jgi:hypothetical protein
MKLDPYSPLDGEKLQHGSSILYTSFSFLLLYFSLHFDVFVDSISIRTGGMEVFPPNLDGYIRGI